MKIGKRILVFVTLVCVLLGIGSVSAAASFNLNAEQVSQETCPTVFTVYQFTVSNTGDDVDTYTVSKSGSAAAWALISPPGFVLQPGDSQSVFVYVTPNRNAQTGSYNLDLAVTGERAGTHTSAVSLTVGDCHSLSISPQQTFQEICTGEATSYTFTAENTGLWTENIRLSLAGSAAQWSSLNEEFVRLDNGQSKTFTIFTEPRANEVGEFDLSITARSLESNALASQDFDLSVKGCYGIELSAVENFASFCENSEVKVPLILRNSGTATNTYNLDVLGAEWVALDRNQISLNAGEQVTIQAVLFPGYGVQGKFPITVTADSIYGEEEDTQVLTANVLKCHDVSLSIAETEDKICPRTSKTYSVDVMNSGTKAEKFSLSLNAPSWIKLDKNSLSLDASGSETVNIIAEPTADTFPSKYTITLDVSSLESSGVNDKDSMSIEIASKDSCFGVKTMAEKQSVTVAYGEGTLIPIVIENIGSETETFSLDVSGNGASFAQLNPSSITVTGNSAETVQLYVAIPDKTEKTTYSITIAARDEAGVVSSSSTIQVSLTDEPTILPESQPEQEESITGITGTFSVMQDEFKGFSNKITGFFTGFSEDGAKDRETELDPEVVGFTNPNFSMLWNLLNEYKYWIVSVIVIVFIISISVMGTKDKPKKSKKSGDGLWKKFTDWLEDEDVEEIELIDEYESKSEDKKKSIWKKFTDWLENEEDDELKELYSESVEKKIKPKKSEKSTKSKKSEKSIWTKFSAWLDEEDETQKPKQIKPKTIIAKKPTKKPYTERSLGKKGKSIWQKFGDWLDEEEEVDDKSKKPKQIKPKIEKKNSVKKEKFSTKPAKKKDGKGLFEKFNDWLNEEDEIQKKPTKTVSITLPKVVKKKPTAKYTPKKKQPKKKKSTLKSFKDWLEEE